jgi:DNA modification methylase
VSVQVLVGNSLEVLPSLQQNSVHCSVTSPPYYGLRKYKGDQQCDWPEVEYSPMPGLPPITIEPMTCALGHEPTIEAYIGHLVAIYREVWRVLRDDGVAWIVMGDSFANDSKWGGATGGKHVKALHGNSGIGREKRHTGLKQGDLMLVPHRLALALQADGWLVRNDVVWAKKAPMPESVRGWHWERHRVKIKDGPRASAGKDKSALKGNRNDIERISLPGSPMSNYPYAKYIDCPGCPRCSPNGGYVLKRGSCVTTKNPD